MKNRHLWIDAVSGILIIYMIVIIHITDWVHMNNHPIYTYGIRVFPFFLAWFFYKSGMLFRKPIESRDYINKCLKKLIHPWVIWSICGFFIWLIVQVFNNSNINISHEIVSYCFYSIVDGCHISNIPIWFLLTLFFVKVLFFMINRATSSFFLWVLICLLPLFLIGFLKQNFSLFITPLWLYNTISGLFFFSVGYYLRNIQYSKKIIGISFIIYVYVFIVDFSYVDMKNTIVLFGNYILFFLSSICGIILTNNIFRISTPFLLHNRWSIPIRILCYIGRKSFLFFVMHWLVYNLFGQILTGFVGLSMYVLLIFTLIPLFDILLKKIKFSKQLGVD